MLPEVGDFKRRVESDIGRVVAQLQELTGRSGRSEELAWRSSLPKVAQLFSSSSFNPLHLRSYLDFHRNEVFLEASVNDV